MGREELIEMAEKCQTEGRHLSKWEESFLEAALYRMGNGNNLTDAQAETLHEIFRDRILDRR